MLHTLLIAGLFLATAAFLAHRYVVTGRVGFVPVRPRRRAPAAFPASRAAGRPAAAPRQDDRYWGVEVQLPENGGCCRFVERFQGVRFPLNDAPPLPLPGCDAAHCRCQFRYLAERRGRSETVRRERRRENNPAVGRWSERP